LAQAVLAEGAGQIELCAERAGSFAVRNIKLPWRMPLLHKTLGP